MCLLYIIPKVCEVRVHARSVSFGVSCNRTCAETTKGCLVVGNDDGGSRDKYPEVSALWGAAGGGVPIQSAPLGSIASLSSSSLSGTNPRGLLLDFPRA